MYSLKLNVPLCQQMSLKPTAIEYRYYALKLHDMII